MDERDSWNGKYLCVYVEMKIKFLDEDKYNFELIIITLAGININYKSSSYILLATNSGS